MLIKGIAFDLEGTVVNVEDAHHGAHLRVCREVGLQFSLEEAIEKIRHFVGGPDQAVVEEIYALCNGTRSVQWISERDAEYYEELLSSMSIRPREGFLSVLRWFTWNGFPVAIGSLTKGEKAWFLLNKSGLANEFPRDRIVLAEDVMNHKPAPDVFLETARRMGIDAAHQLVFEDSPRGVQAALAAGSVAIGMPVYDIPYTRQELINAGVKRIYSNWSEIDPSQLLAQL